MKAAPILLLLLTFLIALGHASAQLGPKDGATLSPTDLERVKVGQAAPDFSLEDMTGKTLSLSDYHATKNVVLVFYRGHW